MMLLGAAGLPLLLADAFTAGASAPPIDAGVAPEANLVGFAGEEALDGAVRRCRRVPAGIPSDRLMRSDLLGTIAAVGSIVLTVSLACAIGAMRNLATTMPSVR